MSNLSDLNTHLFDQLKRLSNTVLKGDDLKEEIERAKAVSSIAKNVADNARLVIDAAEIAVQYPAMKGSLSGVLENKK